jgi:uncharacterized protein YjbI with pentapeptide repeats
MKTRNSMLTVVVVLFSSLLDGCTRTEIRYVDTTNPSSSTTIAIGLEITAEINVIWEETYLQSGEYIDTELFVAGDSIIGLGAESGDCTSVPEITGKLDLYIWDGTAFVLRSSTRIDGSGSDSSMLETFDFTGDDLPEVVLRTDCIYPVTYVYSVGEQGMSELAVATDFYNGTLFRYVKDCLPTCAESGFAEYELKWDGSKFIEILIDQEIMPTTTAVQDLTIGFDSSICKVDSPSSVPALLPLETVENLRDVDLSNAQLAGRSFINTDLSGANLSNADLRGATFINSNLTDTNLRGANLKQATFSYSALIRADLSDANLREVVVKETIFNNSVFIGANLPMNMRGWCLPYVNLSATDLDSKDLSEAILTGSWLRCLTYNGRESWTFEDCVDGGKTNFSNANLQGVDFSGSWFDNAKFDGANLRSAIAVCRGYNKTRFTDATFVGADLTDANVYGAMFGGANLTNASLEGINLDVLELGNTILPDGSIFSNKFRDESCDWPFGS